ncbi:MAG TPA: HepT-like ribonuclease domain-containing protein [Caulobacteraceae bacterium]|jgi:uncharacterized protein with HEPN domain|nr:HepT-like ribonuclease domain-containing protein [Caulobacteraceae bacterium]
MRDDRARLEDIAEALSGIDAALAELDEEGFAESWVVQRAVERGLEIISEASRSVSAAHKSAFPAVPWSQIAGIGNILRHEYHRVEPAIIWNITKAHLPALAEAVRSLLTRGEPEQGAGP